MECLQAQISALPNALILQILSLLPLEEAIRTGILSKRWKGLWTSVPNLIFTHQGKSFQSFFQFVDKSLSLYSSDKVVRFSLRFKYLDAMNEISRAQLDSIVTSWLQFASTHKVEELYVDLEPDDESLDYFTMPRCLYDNPSLRKLYSNFCVYDEPKGQVSWGLLKVLTISTASIADKYVLRVNTHFHDKRSVLEKILQGCPIIEYLEFCNCREFEGVDASSCTRLKKFVLDQTMGIPALDISIPSVISMEILGGYVFCVTFNSLNAPSLVDVTLDYPMDSAELRDNFEVALQDVVYEPLLEKLNHVEQLTLGPWFIQLDEEELETLQNVEENFWEAEERSFECLLTCLKTVEIVGLKPLRRMDGVVYGFVKFILGSARVLERMVLVTEKCSNSEETEKVLVSNSSPFINAQLDDRGKRSSNSGSQCRIYRKGQKRKEKMKKKATTRSKGKDKDPKQKRLKTIKKGKDGISALPDSILHRILSLLPMEEAVRTGVLSKEWKFLWTCVTNLNISDSRLAKNTIDSGDYLKRFFNSMKRTLLLCSSEKIERFSLRFDRAYAPEVLEKSELDVNVTWCLRFATIRNVEDLELLLPMPKEEDEEYEEGAMAMEDEEASGYVMPKFLYQNSSLTKLSSKYCDYKVKVAPVSWTSLKVLTISKSRFKEGMLQKILSGSPLLECLELHGCHLRPTKLSNFHQIDTSSNTRLKRIVIDELTGGLKLSIPNVNSLEILGSGDELELAYFKLLEVSSSLVEVIIDFGLDIYFEDESESELELLLDMVFDLLGKVNHVNQLTVGSFCVQVLSLLEFKGQPSRLSILECKCLTIGIEFMKRDLYGAASLLSFSPNLEKLVIKMTEYPWFHSEELKELDEEENENFWKVKERFFECLLCLKTVEIGLSDSNPVRSWMDLKTGLFEFVEFILGSARVLERMVFIPEKGSKFKADDLYGVLKFPRLSPNAVILLPKAK
ncbi:hypothetical protein CCACVL1_15610 [Corchorus capsularis]|uniref:F-box domain-containing protein n=1 Tax=Corchorus capsularis TaxID=210143 RepID=A0A1R3I1Y6_COCAP|nr:hypothetical protein CCACVL1_15610 [Corchorus capsularis]